jgi:hypothetical protein
MLEALILGAWLALFRLGYATRSYVGTLIPGAALVWAAIGYEQKDADRRRDRGAVCGQS